ncbi:unnamed protein product [Ectocarpus sp. CCAP 1310/34]|nr:unnamed protein product [Ectocarpus sp. CCAP 1310/34]
MASDLPPHANSKTTLLYDGDVQDARQIDGKIWFAVDGQAILTREQQTRGISQLRPASGTTAHTMASAHVVAGGLQPSSSYDADPAGGGTASGLSSPESALLMKAAQVSQTFAAVTALPPGIHVMCYVPPSTDDADEKPAAVDAGGKPVATAGGWSALWRDIRSGTGQAEEAKRLAWQTPCLSLLGDAASSLSSAAISSLADSASRGGWALVPCASSSNLVCELASGGAKGDGGQVAWLHLAEDAQAPATGVAVTDSLLLTSLGGAEVEVISEAHRILLDGVLSGYDLSVAPPNNALLGNVKSSDGEPDRGRPMKVDEAAVFVDHSTAPADVVGQRWRGDVAVVGLPGGGLHRHVRYSFCRASTIVLSAHHSHDRLSAIMKKDARTGRGCCERAELIGDGKIGTWLPLCGDLQIMSAGGFHKHGSQRVRVKFNARCTGKACDDLSERGESQDGDALELCEVLLAQHVPRGAYIDVDEVKARHDFDVLSSPPIGRRVGVETFQGGPIDVELPSSVSGQHLVNFNLWVDMSERDRGLEGEASSIQADLTLPVHLRYPDPGCDRRGEECEGYAWVKARL